MRILVVSDVESEYIWDHFDSERFSDIDLVISCGDLKSEYLSFLATMIQAPVFYVHGNHDIDYEKDPPGGCDCIEDKLTVFKGLRIIGLGGCNQYNKIHPYSRLPFQSTERQMAGRIRRLKYKLFFNNGFDILVTHAPPFGLGDDKDTCHTGFKAFLKLLDKYKPRYMLHGHMHLKFGRGERKTVYNETTIIDACGYFVLEI
jgi:Icc-related predicted phosphoesterase